MQDVQEIRGLARDFAAAELRPHTEQWDAAGRLDDEVIAGVAELGFFGMLLAEADGGMGFDAATCIAALEELAWGEPSVALLVAQNMAAADVIARHGDAALRQRWLEPLATGTALATIATPDNGANALKAVKTDDAWRLTGTVCGAPGADRASLAIVQADVDGSRALFVAARDAGFAVHGRSGTLGLRPIGFAELAFDAVSLDVDARLTVPSDAAQLLSIAELAAAAVAVGIAQASLEHAIGYAAQREQFGRPIRTFEGVWSRLADMAARTIMARTLLQQAAQQPDDAILVATAKIAAGDAAMFVTDDAVQVFGGYGYMLLFGGTDTQRARIADALYQQ
jgi:alkylation response protein AidB-like acyl-CoA dehydrogenase